MYGGGYCVIVRLQKFAADGPGRTAGAQGKHDIE